MKKLFLYALFASVGMLQAAQISLIQKLVAPKDAELLIHVRPDDGEAILKDHISLAADHPDVTLTQWTTTAKPTTADAKGIGSALPAFTEPFTIVSHVKNTGKLDDVGIYFTYLSSKQRQPIQELFTITFNPKTNLPVATNNDPLPPTADDKNICTPPIEPVPSPKSFSLSAWSQYLEDIIKATNNFWVRFFLILLLGLFMSFTPCIYPMIPITVGILQGSGRRSFWHNVAHAGAYSTGVAITFAILGLIAAASGTIFGSMMTSPFVVLLIAALLIYLAGTMFGWYELYIPRSFQERQHTHQGSILSSFIFGAISGTVASPCLSPGLALVLCIVASLGSKSWASYCSLRLVSA